MGPQGETGPQGQNGQSTSYFNYLANTTITGGDPGSNYIAWDDAVQYDAAQLYISHIDANNVDIDIFLDLLKTGDYIILQDSNNSNRYQKWQLNSDITVNVGYVEAKVNLIFQNHSFSNDDQVALFIISQGVQGPQGVQGFQGPTGPQGTAGPQGFSYPVSANAAPALWYNSSDAIDPNFESADNLLYEVGNLYIQRGSLYFVENAAIRNVQKMALTTEPLTGSGRTWSIPNTSDTFAGLASTQILSNKTFTSIKINPSGVTSSQGDIFYTPTTGANIERLAIGRTGSILSTNNNIPTWTSTTATNSIPYVTIGGTLSFSNTGVEGTYLSIINNVPTWDISVLKSTTPGLTLSASQTANTIVKSILIPANTVRSGDIPSIDVRGRKVGAVTSNTVRLYLNTTNSLSGASLIASYANAATMLYYQLKRDIRVIGTSASQVYQAAGTGATSDTTNNTVTTTDITNNWSLDQYLIVAHQHTAASDSSNVDFIRLINL